jgi:hypothetical protein
LTVERLCSYNPSGLTDYPKYLEYQLKNPDNQFEQRSKAKHPGEWALLLFFVRKAVFVFRHRITSLGGKTLSLTGSHLRRKSVKIYSIMPTNGGDT